MAAKHLNNSWNRERNRLFCWYTMDVTDEHVRSMLTLEENLSDSTDSKTGVVLV